MKQQLHPLLALAAGALLYFVPALLLPVLRAPIDAALHALGLLSAGAGSFEASFLAAQVLRWLAAALLVAFVLGVERAPLSSIGIRPLRWRDLASAVGVAVLALALGAGLYLLVQGPRDLPGTQTSQVLQLPLGWRAQVGVNAAVVEELFFRGFLIERLVALTGRPWLAGVVSYVLFVGSHLPGSGVSLTLTMVAVHSAALVGLYVLRRNVVACIVAHWLIDLTLLIP